MPSVVRKKRESNRLDPLTVESLMATPKAGRHADGGGLYLVVEPNGSARWSFIFQWRDGAGHKGPGRLREMGLGSAKTISLRRARERATEARGLPTAWLTGKAIRARILEETGLTASAGVSYNKFLAKLASGQRKPNGQCAIMPEEGAAFVEALPVAKFHGVGPATATRMHAAGIQTGADLKTWSLQDLQHRFGKAGSWYYSIARGQDNRAVNPNRERKSSGSETTFDEDLTDPARIEAGVRAMADEVWAWCEKTGGRGRTVTVKIKWADFQQSTRSQSLARPVDSRATLHEASLGLIRSVFPPLKGIRLVGVTLSNFAGQQDSVPWGLSLLPESDAAV